LHYGEIIKFISKLKRNNQYANFFTLATYPMGVYNTHDKRYKKARRKIMECGCRKTKERSEKEYKDLINRLNRIEGQVRGIKGMVEKDAYCTDILTQVAAVNAALNSFNKVLLSNHIKTCVIRDIKEGKEETVDDLLATLQKLMR
jgi:DNA-binding FrmR family transcriptional regulator